MELTIFHRYLGYDRIYLANKTSSNLITIYTLVKIMPQNLYESVSYDQIVLATFSTTCHHPYFDKVELMHHIIIEMDRIHTQC